MTIDQYNHMIKKWKRFKRINKYKITADTEEERHYFILAFSVTYARKNYEELKQEIEGYKNEVETKKQMFNYTEKQAKNHVLTDYLYKVLKKYEGGNK
ncbi:MAG: hypothetical protein ACOC56_04500 [Atribacterota bacterium]